MQVKFGVSVMEAFPTPSPLVIRILFESFYVVCNSRYFPSMLNHSSVLSPSVPLRLSHSNLLRLICVVWLALPMFSFYVEPFSFESSHELVYQAPSRPPKHLRQHEMCGIITTKSLSDAPRAGESAPMCDLPIPARSRTQARPPQGAMCTHQPRRAAPGVHGA